MKRISNSIVILSICITAVLVSGCATMQSSPTSASSGKSGSMARFTIQNDFLYTVSDDSLHIFNLEKRSHPRLINTLKIGWGTETIFAYENLLFFGTRTGMRIYHITDPENPMFLSEYRHIYSCDPVVVENGYAYVTLRTQSQCRRGNNELHIYDIKDPALPIKIKSYPMGNPWGLGIDGENLFVCDGKYGLKVFNVRNPEDIQEIETLKDVNGYDVIPNDEILIVSARDGIYQFDYSTKKLKKLSHIEVGY